MALINCPECNKKISSSATRCPICGFELANFFLAQSKIKNFKREAKFAFYFFIIVCLYIFWITISNLQHDGKVHFKLVDKDKIVFEKILSYKHMLNSDGKYYDKNWCIKGCKVNNLTTRDAIREEICGPLLRQNDPNHKYYWSCEIYSNGSKY